MITKIEAFMSYLNSHLGDMYVWGGQGECVTAQKDPEAWITAKEKKQGNSFVNRAIAYYRKTTKRPLYAFDCSGLIVNFLLREKLIKSDTTAQGLYSMCVNKAKGTSNLQVGDLVFIYKGVKMTHVGVYIGNGMTIESYGRDKGVCKLLLEEGKWTHSGRLQCLQGEVISKPYHAVCGGQGVNVRLGRGTTYPTLGKLDKNSPMLAITEKDGWCEIACVLNDKIVTGYMSKTYVK